jgi:hypothetical protein
MRRLVSAMERELVVRMCEGLPAAQRGKMLADLANASVELLNDDGSILRFELHNYIRSPGAGRRIAVDGTASDRDGAHLNVILFIDENDRLYELELVRFDEGKVVGPNIETFKEY